MLKHAFNFSFFSNIPNALLQLRHFGVKEKLGASIVGIVFITTVAIGIAVLEFNSADKQFHSFSEIRVPALVDAGEMAIKSSEMTIAASELIGANQEEKRVKAFNELSEAVKALQTLSQQKESDAIDDAELEKFKAQVSGFNRRLDRLDELTSQNLIISDGSSKMLTSLFNVNGKISNTLAPLVSKAYNGLKTEGSKAATQAEDIVNRLLNEEVDGFQVLLSLRTEVGTMGGAAAAFLLLEDPKLARTFKTSMARAAFRIPSFVETLQQNNQLSQELADKLLKLSKFSDEATKLEKVTDFSFNNPTIQEYITRLIALQADVDKELIANAEDKFNIMSLNAQDAAAQNKELINKLTVDQVNQVRTSLEAISTVRQFTALAVQGALSNDPKLVGQMQSGIGFVVGRLNKLAGAMQNEIFTAGIEELQGLVHDKTGLIAQRLKQLKINEQVVEIVDEVHTDTKIINSTIHNIIVAERNEISVSSAALSQELKNNTLLLIGLAVVAILATLMVGALVVNRGIVKPLTDLIHSTRLLADGNLEAPIGYTSRIDELGQFAKALMVFRDNAIEKARIEQEADAKKNEVEKERERNELAKTKATSEIKIAVTALGSGLKKLSDGKLNIRLDQAFVESLEMLRQDFNQSLETLEGSISRVAMNTIEINENSASLKDASTLLSTRTEAQANSIEETARTVNHITSKVSVTSNKALEVSDLVGEARKSATDASEVVNQAIHAMSKIEDTSKEISSIISMIDEIAFQTNLLALNAGVEAARAGDSGRGFAVVAQEVRELAGRATNAAKDIETLINTSRKEVDNGVMLVKSTGSSIDHIEEKVQNINSHIVSIAESAKEQSTDLEQINSRISELDQMTQQNAAMAEESNTSTQLLARLANELTEMISMFDAGKDGNEVMKETEFREAS